MADERGLLDRGADHHPWRVDERDDGDVERVAELQEPRRLVGAVAVDRACEVVRVVGHDADGPPLDAGQRGDHPQTEVVAAAPAREPVSKRPSIDRADVVAALAILGDHVAQLALIGALTTRRSGPWKYERYCLATATAFGLVGDGDVDHAVELLHAHRADLGRVEHAEPATFDHRRPAHADVGVGGGDHHVAAARASPRCRRSSSRR